MKRFFLGLALGAFIGALFAGTGQPALVGYGCEGAQGLLYAYNEDDFPLCKAIDVRD